MWDGFSHYAGGSAAAFNQLGAAHGYRLVYLNHMVSIVFLSGKISFLIFHKMMVEVVEVVEVVARGGGGIDQQYLIFIDHRIFLEKH